MARLFWIAVAAFLLVTVGRSSAYTLHADTDTVHLFAKSGDTASVWLRIYDGRDPSSKPIHASVQVYGNNNCQVATPHQFTFAGSAYLLILYVPAGPQSQGLMTITTDNRVGIVQLASEPSSRESDRESFLRCYINY